MENQFYVQATDTEEPLGDNLTYAEAVALLNEKCGELAQDGWTVERGWASSGNYAAAKATKDGADDLFVAVELDS